MKKIIKNQISYILVFLVAICMTLVPVRVEAATTDDIISIVPNVENGVVKVTGTTGADVVAVLVEIFDKDNNLVTMETHKASNGIYEATIDVTLTEGETYLFYVVNFNGKGAKASVEYEVPKKAEDIPDTKPDEGTDTKPDEGTDTKPDEGTDTKPDEGTDTKPDEGTDTKPETKPTLPEGTVITSSTDSNTSLKDIKGILPENTKLETEKITEQKTVDKVTELVSNELKNTEKNDKELKQVVVYEMKLFDGTTELHQLANKVEVSITLPFEVSPNGKLLVYRVDGEKLIPCASRIYDGKLIFETDHFSTFLFVELQEKSIITSPNTGDRAPVIPLAVLYIAGIVIGGVALISYRRRQTR